MERESFPDGLTETEFRSLYRERLDRLSADLIARLRAPFARTDNAPDVVVEAEVFAEDDGDGFVSVETFSEGRNTQVRKADPSLYSGFSIDLTSDFRVRLYDPKAYEADTRHASVPTVNRVVLVVLAGKGVRADERGASESRSALNRVFGASEPLIWRRKCREIPRTVKG